MRTLYITELDAQLHRGSTFTPMGKALKDVENHILRHVDGKFDIEAFREWCDSPTEKPFKCHKIVYQWDRKGAEVYA